MPAKRELTMRQIRQMLRLARDGVSAREIGRTLGVARSTIQDNLKRAAVAGLAWPLAGPLTDAVLEQRLFAHAGVKRGFRRRAEPDWGSLACELKRPGVNLMVLWEEYRAIHPSGYGYSRFCDLLTLAHAQTSFSAGQAGRTGSQGRFAAWTLNVMNPAKSYGFNPLDMIQVGTCAFLRI
jgi:Homeodomain-like domain